MGVMEIQNSKIILFQYPSWPPWSSINSSYHIFSQTVSLIGSKLDVRVTVRHWVTWRFKIVKLFSSNIQDGSHDGNLETLQTTSDSGLLKAI